MDKAFAGFGKGVRDYIHPTHYGGDREERILVEYQGNIHSEAEEFFYGLEGCPVLKFHDFTKYHEMQSMTPLEVYREIAFYRPDDLLTCLNDGNELAEDEIELIKEYCKKNYTFKNSTLLSLSYALNKLLEEPYVKGLTIVFDSITEKDAFYINDIFNSALLEEKVSVVVIKDTDMCTGIKNEILKAIEEKFPYTTIITNEANLIIDMLREFKTYDCESNFFLLRNHSKNMIMKESGDKYAFDELFTKDIVRLISPIKERLIDGEPLPLRAKFARYSPLPYNTEYAEDSINMRV